MKYIKTFEKINNDIFSKPDIDKFFISTNNDNEIKLNIIHNIRHNAIIHNIRHNAIFDVRVFVFRNNEFIQTYNDTIYYDADFINFIFLSKDELYKKYPDLCVILYLDISNDFIEPTTWQAEWYIKLYNMLKTTPGLIEYSKFYKNGKKYNIF
jgi:hypothetical protein